MRKGLLHIALAFLMMLCHTVGTKAQERVYTSGIPSGPSSFMVGAQRTVQDPIYDDPALRALCGPVKKMYNVVTLGIDEESGYFIPGDFNTDVLVRITKKPVTGGSDVVVDKTLHLSYRTGMGKKSDAASYYVDETNAGYKITAEIISISNPVSWDIRNVLRLNLEIHSEYDAPFNPGIGITGLQHSALPINPADEFIVTWNYPTNGSSTFSNNPTDYDLEWAWVDATAEANYKTGGEWDPAKIYSNNATRITIPVSISSYRIPLLYDVEGWIFYRVRPVQQRMDGQVINGLWTTGTTEGLGAYHLTAGHEEGLNWQQSTTFAEDGKRKTVIQYFDGTLRGRQTVTKDNSQANPTTVVAETYYDYQGRPTIQVLPAPTLNNVISFTRNFNNNNIDHNGYPKEIYDLLATGQTACGNGAPALDKTTGVNGANGAGNYYSAQNPLANTGIHKFIPEANGFAFTETRYTQDGTGRVLEQSGVGQAFKLGSGHESKYYYSSATQDELDILFGTDAGNASHYQKTVVRDANGQYSVSYTDMFGRTVATALAGESPASLQQLPSLQALHNAALPAVKKQLLDEETNVVKGRSIEMVKDLVVTSAGIRHFEYRLDPKQLLLKNCQQQNICYDCLYDLEIVISDACTRAVVHTETKNNFSIPYNSVCGTDPANIDIDFDVLLAEGVYTITKTLTLSKDAQDRFRDQAMTNGNLVCKTFLSIQEEIATIMTAQNANCKPTCESCTQKLSGGWEGYKQQFILAAGIAPADTVTYVTALKAAYDEAVAACAAICESGSDRVTNYRELMLLDMMPDRGQYARIKEETAANGDPLDPPVDLTVRPENIFNNGKYKVPKSEDGNETPYKDEFGINDPQALTELSSWSPDQFTEHFNESWANQLISYHPEFKKLKLVEAPAIKTAYHWQEQLQDKDKWAEVSGTVSGSSGLPFADPLFSDPLAGSLTAMQAKIAACVPVKLSSGATYYAGMWQFAIASVKCLPLDGPAQISCLQACSNTIGTFPADISCDADKNAVWKIFRTLYLREREVLIQDYLQANAYVNPAIFDVPATAHHPRYQARFINPNSVRTLVPADLQSLYDEVNNPNPHDDPQMNSALQAQYEENCRSYVETWLQQVKAFDNCTNNAITVAQYNTLMEQLVSICKRGSDLEHPMGSSSTAPGQENPGPSTFEQTLENFMTANGITLSATCHPYLINWPKPYDRSPILVNEEIDQTTPEDCVCERLASLHTQHQAALNNGTFNGDFLSYLKTVHGTIIAAPVLAQLESLCNPTTTPACKFLETPIVLPPALQCKATNNTCISCAEYGTFKAAFLAKFGTAIPSGLNLPVMFPANETEQQWNKAFAEFMNFKTGFSKQWHEYANFEKGCAYNNDPAGTGICARLDQHILAFNDLWPTLDDGETSCFDLFARYFNAQEGTQFTYLQLKFLYVRCKNVSCLDLPLKCYTNGANPPPVTEAVPCAQGFPTHLCGLNDPITPQVEIDPDDPCKDVDQMIWNATVETYNFYIKKVKNDFDKAYQDKCLAVQALESFTVQSPGDKEYHYTLYFYDQSGSLVQTVPPAGVDNFNNNAATRDAFLASVKAARANPNAAPVRPYHTLPTTYRYNTLGQVVEQQSPDGGLSRFWYDELGRLVVSQNAKQRNNNQYSYTLYDELGRISQVGQKPTTEGMTQAKARNKTLLQNFLNNGQPKEQITRTVYDVSYVHGGADLGSTLVQRNLRNRVSYSQVVPVEPANASNPGAWAEAHSTATYYTYDIHGNVDELLQDFNEGEMKTLGEYKNRFKKIAYTYDLISGKVNTVTYQPDYYTAGGTLVHHIDRFYHRYDYDAENKLTSAETSHDGIIWEKDARYIYYKHGPLARTELGHQRVQGVDYAYTLQGWLKGVNSTAISAGATEECAPGTARDVLDIFHRDQYQHPQNYVARREINFFPQFTTDDTDDVETTLNASLAPCVPVIRNTPYITGDMGQDGNPAASGAEMGRRYVARDAYSFSLNFYQATIDGNTVYDYQAINAAQPFTSAGMFNLQNADATPATVAKPLFNGNIASMFVNIPVLAPGGSGSAGAAMLYGYRYDQLNRIVSMDAFNGFNPTANGWYNGVATASKNYRERISYDANGNILSYLRNGSTTPPPTGGVGGGGGPLEMDNLYYQYPKYANTPANIANRTAGKLMNNRLRFVQDEVAATNYNEDIDNQTTLSRSYLESDPASWQPETAGDDNYVYDEIGNLVRDVKEGITNIEWNVYGKIAVIHKGAQRTEYQYDAGGNRIAKIIYPPDRGLTQFTYYVRDASGNVMAIYEKATNGDLKQTEVHLYGSSRLGIFKMDRNVENPEVNSTGIYTFTRGNKFFELSNHLGNVLVTISDRKLQVHNQTVTTEISYYAADVITATDYYPFGMDMQGRKYELVNRYGFNGKERDTDIGSSSYDFGARIYDGKIGRWLSIDPLQIKNTSESPYIFCKNKPITHVDPDGKDAIVTINGNTITISCKIVIYGKDATSVNAKMLQSSINTHWNKTRDNQGWKYIDNETGKFYKVKFEATVELYNGKEKQDPIIIPDAWNPFSRTNYIEIDNSVKRSYVNGGWDEGAWIANGRTAAHEFGHLLALKDRYKDETLESGEVYSRPDKGWEGNIMANSKSGIVEQRNVDAVVGPTVHAYNKELEYLKNSKDSGIKKLKIDESHYVDEINGYREW
ncbi:MAG: DUF6443 domain-containing protein [Bacteroidetes bacterium]|nr:DUF6443 domain-containing protein [Bacteroidota bacterium]